MSTSDMVNRFRHYEPDDDKIVKHSEVRNQALDLAMDWEVDLPAGREKALALTKLEEAMFWANAAIARN